MKKTLFIGLLIYCSCSSQSIDDKIHWKKVNDLSEALYFDTIKVQQNHYKNGKIDSFDLYDYINKTRMGGYIHPDSFNSFISGYHGKDFIRADSFFVTFWKPVERNQSYKYEIIKDDKIVWNKNMTDMPIFPFSNKFDDDTAAHLYKIRFWIIDKNKDTKGPYLRSLWKARNKQIEWL